MIIYVGYSVLFWSVRFRGVSLIPVNSMGFAAKRAVQSDCYEFMVIRSLKVIFSKSRINVIECEINFVNRLERDKSNLSYNYQT